MRAVRAIFIAGTATLAFAGAAGAHEPEFTSDFHRERCTFTTASLNPYLPLWPGYSLLLEGEEEDGGEIVELAVAITILPETERVDGVVTRVLEEREEEDGELLEVSRNFVAVCRETGDVWYFGEDVDNYENGQVVDHDGSWRAGAAGAEPGVLMPGSPMVGARYFQEMAPGIALDRAEVTALDASLATPAGTFEDVLTVDETNALNPSAEPDFKAHAPGVGQIADETLRLTEIEEPPCRPDATTLCLNDGRFEVQVEWRDGMPREGDGKALLPSDDSGEFWFFNANNTELIVKVIDACTLAPFNSFWVFAAGLTNVEVTLTVTDTETEEVKVYESELGTPFEPILDTAAFETCL